MSAIAVGIIGSLLIVSGCGAQSPKESLVRDAAALKQAIASARPGDTIRLAGGTYGPLDLGQRWNGPAELSIRSANPADPAIFSSVTARGITGLSLSHVMVIATEHDPKRPYLIHVEGGSGIRLDHVDVKGAGGEERFREYALWLRRVTDVEVRNSTFSGTRYGIGLLNGRKIMLTDNELSGIQTDGIRGGGVDDLTISRNVLTDFLPKAGEHPDGIQLWSTNQSSPARRITISDNLIARGAGHMTQGIFVRDTLGRLPFEDVEITGNLVIGSMYNGIAVLGLSRGRIENNRVVPYGDQKAWIRIDKASGVTLSGNEAPQFLSDGKAANPRGNKSGVRPTMRAGEEVRAWLSKRPSIKERPGRRLTGLAAQ